MAAVKKELVTEIPKGFDSLTRPDINGWVAAEVGVIVYGTIVGSFVIEASDEDEKDQRVLLIELAQEVSGVEANDEKKKRMFNAGEVVGLSERSMIADAFNYKSGATVFIKFEKQQALKGKRSVWKGQCAAKGERLPQVASTAPF